MDKESNIVYVETKNGIFKCYKSEQMRKPIYYPVESKTNGYIDYYDVINILTNILTIDDLYKQVKKQQEVIDDYKEDILNLLDIINKNCNELKCTSDEWLVIQKYQDREEK